MSEHELTGPDFDAYFEALWKKTPFPWQQALARRLLGEDLDNPKCDWPEAITLPTAAGKTACIDIAVFALAAQASRQEQGKPLTAPRRIFFVVDRRIIVDEAFERTRCLAERLAEAKDGILGEVADCLRHLAGNDEPLACFQLRGGIYRNNAWARSPIQPTVVCSTVDQIGSRLLFRGYGRSFKAWHLEAGLAGNDALILLDEAHCAQPFLDTLKAIDKYRRWAEKSLPLPFRTTILTATPPKGVEKAPLPPGEGLGRGDRRATTGAFCDIPPPAEVTPFPDPQTAAADRAHPVLKRRLEASKPCRLEIAEKAKGKDAAKVSRALAETLVKEAEQLVTEYTGQESGTADILSVQTPSDASRQPAVAIFCNRVATVRAVFERLRKRGQTAALLTGRMRPFDRDELIAGPLDGLDATKAETRRIEAPFFVAATQTLEVGANLDFDLMVTECADLSALRQRFGRLNRMGRDIPAQGVIVVRADQTEEQKDRDKADPIYGNALPKTWQWLLKQCDDKGRVDMGVSALETRLKDEDLKPFTAEANQAPVMEPAHLDALAQTAPAPLPSPEPSLFLHGLQTGPADVRICWRADLDPKQELDGGIEERDLAWIDAITLCPPAAGELMPVPFAAFRRWMQGGKPAVDTGDIEGIPTDEDTSDTNAPETSPRIVVRWLGREDAEVIDKPDKIYKIRPGDVIVIPAALEGWDILGHKPKDSPVDRGEEAHLRARARAVLRLHPDVLAGWPLTADAREKLMKLAEKPDRIDSEPELLTAEIKEILQNLPAGITEKRKADGGEKGAANWLLDVAEHLARERRLDRCIQHHPCAGLVITSKRRVKNKQRSDDVSDFSHEDDSTASGTVRRELEDHLQGVACLARRFGGHLPPPIAEDIRLAALCHDLGKADPRFQALLHGDNPWTGGPLLAKSGIMRQGYRASERARRNAGYPKGGRHELLSVRLLENAPELLKQAHDPDLVLHLIASHHGYCRPFAPVVDDSDPRDVSLDFEGHTLSANSATGLERLDSGVAERFWHLIRRYGWWGLAGLEAILILSDHRRSEWEENHSESEKKERSDV
ncbi:type I-G CRISPR-associated helicase/endonuclease Cas3g [Candidatus Thiosymbion oneisti]|uniref:type I-G CRISPR-associated helicase/endonuclease Cas3g n=1 Tax=Candidatus Thiosymbion oneisti TaxID=589554 RepID=UPI000AA4CEEC|nr:CRISPR-associated endonuclease Cas3'' [Candidatus Thiosymbion oneisti]